MCAVSCGDQEVVLELIGPGVRIGSEALAVLLHLLKSPYFELLLKIEIYEFPCTI